MKTKRVEYLIEFKDGGVWIGSCWNPLPSESEAQSLVNRFYAKNKTRIVRVEVTEKRTVVKGRK